MNRVGQGKFASSWRLRTAALALASIAALGWAAPASARERPNIIVISTDDQAKSWFSEETMPQTFRHVVRKGTSFENAIAPTPLCCPSRAAFLTGQYGHNNGVLRNRYGDLESPGNVLPVWLQQAGYVTAHVGKWLNDYEGAVDDPAKPAPGWDLWRTSVGNPTYWDAKFSVDGRVRRFGRAPRDLYTKRVGLFSRRALRRLADAGRPFYLQVDEYAPHGDQHHHEITECPSRTPEPAAAKYEIFRDARQPRKRGFNEHDVTDKPPWVQATKPISRATRKWLRLRYRCALASIRTADSQIGKLMRLLKTLRLAESTVVIFWSDNGFLAGEHRMVGKARPYEQALRIPLVIKVPPQIAGRRPAKTVSEPVANIDLAPTILRYAGGLPCAAPTRCRELDGRSLVSLIRDRRGSWPENRLLLVEKDRGDDGALPAQGSYDEGNPACPSNPYDPYAPCDPGRPLPNGSACTFKGLWTPRLTYSVYTSVWDRDKRCVSTRQIEIFATKRDPWQLESLSPFAESYPRKVLGGSSLAAELARLEDCAGTAPSALNPCD